MLRCVVCGRYVPKHRKLDHVASHAVGRELKIIVALADATDDEKTFIKKHWERLPDDYQLQARDRVCYPCQVIAPEIACRKSENWTKAMAQVRDKTWDAHYKQLQTFVAKEKHADCPHGYKDRTTGFDLGVWVQRQRVYKRKGTLLPEREELLTELGVTWNFRRGTKRKR